MFLKWSVHGAGRQLSPDTAGKYLNALQKAKANRESLQLTMAAGLIQKCAVWFGSMSAWCPTTNKPYQVMVSFLCARQYDWRFYFCPNKLVFFVISFFMNTGRQPSFKTNTYCTSLHVKDQCLAQDWPGVLSEGEDALTSFTQVFTICIL